MSESFWTEDLLTEMAAAELKYLEDSYYIQLDVSISGAAVLHYMFER